MTRSSGLLALLACALAGCAGAPTTPTPEVRQPSHWTATPLPDATAGTADVRDRAQSLAGEAAARRDWWSDFGGRPVDALVRRALDNNPTVASATATLRQARELTRAQSATLWPIATVTLGGVQAHGAGAAVVNSGAPRTRSALVSASYAPDLFGMGRAGVASAQAQEDAARWQLAAVRLTLAGAVLNGLTAERAALRMEQMTRQLVEIDARLLTILQARESLGDVAAMAVWAQTQQLHDRQAQLAAARLQTAQARDLMASLLGEAPGDFVEPAVEFDDLLLPDIAPRLPGDLIERRPDVQMAAAQLRAADAGRQAALAALLPQVTLTGDTGFVAASVSRLLNPASFVWDLGVSATQNLFDAGAHRHLAAAAQAQTDAQAEQYRATIVNAFKDVADGLEAVRHDADADVEAVARMQAAQRQSEIASGSQVLGQISRQDLLALQAQAIQVQLLQVQARANRLMDAANVMVSLGGSPDADGKHVDASRIPLAVGGTIPQPTPLQR